jgi:chromosomal replication initiator protein
VRVFNKELIRISEIILVTTALEKSTVWNEIVALVEHSVDKHVADSWFRTIEFEGLDTDNSLIKLRANQITKNWVADYYSALLAKCLESVGLNGYTIEWEIVENPAKDDIFNEDSTQETERPLFDLAAAENSRGMGVLQARTRTSDGVETMLNPKYTFEKFVVGSSNQFAHAASLGAAETPGKTYNPLYIYGGTGLGKTHLMHAIGHSIKTNSPHFRVLYVTSEKFMNETVNAIRYNQVQEFRDKYRAVDVLLVDDIQFFAGKGRTQEEFFHTFNVLHNNQKQIVVSSDCQPREIPTLEERLHSRFEWGLIADIEPPDLETKVAILKRKAELDGIDLPDDIAIFIASKIRSNVRELEGSLIRLVAIASLRGVPISKMVAQEAMKNILDNDRNEGLTIEKITRIVAAHYKLSVEEIKSKSNSRVIAFPRQIAMYLCKRLTNHSYPEIGREFGGKHHTTVMHSFDKIDSLMRKDRVFHNTISELIDNLCS